MTTGFYSRLAGFVYRRRWAVLVTYFLVSVLLGWLGSGIRLKADLSDLLPAGTASGDDLRFFLERFGTTDALFFTVTLEDEGDDDEDRLEEAASLLAAGLKRTGLFRSIRYGFSEEEGIELARSAMTHFPVLMPSEKIDALRKRVTTEGIREALTRLKSSAGGLLMVGALKKVAAEDPLGLLDLVSSPAGGAGGPVQIDPGSGLLLSPDGRTLLMLTMPVKPPQNAPFSRELLAAVEKIEQRVAADTPGIRFDHAGGYLFAVQDESRIKHDIIWTTGISMSAILILFMVVLRRAGLLLALTVPLALSTLWTLGIAVIYPGHLNLVTVAFAAILLGMGDDSLTHLYLRFREEAVEGVKRSSALAAALVSTGPSIVVATLTSGLAFASLTFVKFRGLSELGIIAAIGLMSLLVSVLLLFPALLALGSARISAREGRPSLTVPMGAFIAFHHWAMRRRGLVLTATAILTVAAGLACTRLQFSSDLAQLRGDDPAKDHLMKVLAPFGGMPDAVYLLSDAATPEDALRGAETLAPLCATLQDEGLITGFTSVASWLPSHATQRARFEQVAAINWPRVASVTRATMDGMEINSVYFDPFFTRLNDFANWERVRIDPPAEGSGPSELGPGLSGTATATTLYPAPGVPPSRIVARAREIGGQTGFRAASIGLVLGDLTAVIENDFFRASLLALGAVLLTAIIAFRTLTRLVLVGLPVLIGCLLMLGGLAVLGVPINLMNLVATPLVFGLGIHFGVYIVNRHEEEGRADIPHVLRHTGGAILLTGLTTLSGFGSLLAAQFAGLRSMGWVAVLGIGGCLLSSLLILPLLLPKPVVTSPASGTRE